MNNMKELTLKVKELVIQTEGVKLSSRTQAHIASISNDLCKLKELVERDKE